MYEVEPRFLRTLATAHGMRTQVDILYDGETVAEDIPFTEGSVSVDRGSDVRRTLRLTVPDPSVFPKAASDPYAPYGQQLFVQRGIRYLDGTETMIPLGFFVLEEIQGDIHQGPLTITAPGLEWLIQSEPLSTAVSTASYGTVAGFIRDQLEEVIPDVSFADQTDQVGSGPIATTTWDAGSDRWAALQKTARSFGAELYVDAAGTFVLADIPDPLLKPVDWTISAGEGGVMVSAVRSLSGDGVFNRVVAHGENVSDNQPPVSGEARIEDPNDPLRYGGPFGRRTKHYQSDLITTEGQARVTARALLTAYRAPNSSVTVESVPNPALDAGDCIRVVYGNGDPPELHLVQSFEVPLAVHGSMVIETVSGREELEE